jgi:transcriptional regulator with XRE-family HTH domain
MNLALLPSMLQAKRRAANLSVRDAAKACGIPPGVFHKAESGNTMPSPRSLGRLLQWLNNHNAVVYHPTKPLPEIVGALLDNDKSIAKQDAEILTGLFKSAYENAVVKTTKGL